MNDILSELSALKADYSAAQTLLDEAKNAKAAFDTQLSDKDNALAQAGAAFAAKEQELADKVAAFTALQAELDELKASQKTAEEKAVDIAASAGIAPMPSNPAQEPALTRDEAISQYANGNAEQRASLWAEHRNLLFGN